MPTTPITLTPVGGPLYSIVSGHLFMPCRGAWIIDVEISADSLQQFGMPSGKVVVVIGGVPMSGTIDPASSGTFGPTGKARVVAGANGWSTSPPPQDWHFDNGVLSTIVYQATGAAVGEVVVDPEPTTFNVDFVRRAGPAMQVFGDSSWFLDPTGTTFVGDRPPSIADPSLVIRDWDPINQRATFSCDTLLFPNTTLIDPRFNATTFTVWNVEQIFDGQGSTGLAWSNTAPVSLVTDDLKAATLYWTRAGLLRAYRYRLVQYQGQGPGGGPPRQALQAVTPTAGVPDLVPITPWSGVAGVVSELAPSQEVLVVFENADPTVPRVISYSLVTPAGQPVGLPLSTTMDAQVALNIGPTVPLVNIAGGTDFLVLATPYASMLSALSTFASAVSTATSVAQVASAGVALASALGGLPTPATLKTKAA
jgi:hypothetical protein